MANENAVFNDIELDEEELSLDDLEATLETELETQLSDLHFLEEECKQINNPDSLGAVIVGEIWTQFGNQIGLDMTNETLIQAYEREHPEAYSKAIGDEIMKDEKYKKANKAMKDQQQAGKLKDSYTGQDLGPQDKANLDHVVPRKELYDNKRRKQAGIDTKDLANKDENLAPTNENLNTSKKAKTNQEYIDWLKENEENLKKQNQKLHEKIEKSNKSDAEKRIEHEKADKALENKLAANEDLMMQADSKARKAINRDIAAGVAKQTAKKAGKDALKQMAVVALFALLRTIMNALIRFFKEKQKSFKLFLSEMKAAIKQFINHLGDFFRAGASSAIGTVISEIFGPIVSMFKKLASLIKQGVTTLNEAIHCLTSKENKNLPLNVKIVRVGQIITAGLVAGGALVLGEVFEKALLNIPFMATPIPGLGTIANISGMFLAILLCGVIGAIIINRLNHYIAKQQKSENLSEQIDAKNRILKTQDKLISAKSQKLNYTLETANQEMSDLHRNAATYMSEILTSVCDTSDEESEKLTDEALDDLL